MSDGSVATSPLAVALLLATLPACSRPNPSGSPPADASGLLTLSVRVPAALTVTRALDSLSVAVDPTSLGLTEVTAHAGTFLGVEANAVVFRQGTAAPLPGLEHRRVRSGTDFEVATSWSVQEQGVPAPGLKYAVEVHFVVFETDVTPGPDWDPHAGRFRELWSRSLRQAEE